MKPSEIISDYNKRLEDSPEAGADAALREAVK